jgi:hypothetical protein
MVELASWLPWKQSRISEAERGLRPIPAFVPERIRELEAAREALVDDMIDGLEEGGGGTFLMVHKTDAGYRAAHGHDAVIIPASVQRVAAARAAAWWEEEHGVRPHIAFRDDVS